MIKTLAAANKSERVKVKVPRSVQQSIPIKRIYTNGIWEVGNKHSRSWKLTDVNYIAASQETRESIFSAYCGALNSMPTDATAKITIVNHRLNPAEFERRILFPYKDDWLDHYREEANGIMKGRAAQSNNLVQERFVTLSIPKRKIEESKTYFRRAGANLQKTFARLDSGITPARNYDRLRVLHDFFRPGYEQYFDYDDYLFMRTGKDFRDLICPDSIAFKRNHFEFGDKFGRVLFLRTYASFLTDDLISDLTEFARNLILSIDMIPVPTDEAVKEVESIILGVETDITRWQQRQNSKNNFTAEVPRTMEQKRENSRNYMDDLTQNDQRMIFSLITIVHTADSLEELDADTESLIAIGKEHLCDISPARFQQEDGLNTVLPYALRRLHALHTLTTESCAVAIPFRAQEIQDPGGLSYGINEVSKNPLICDRKRLVSPHAFYLGISGSGKSMGMKSTITSVKKSLSIIILLFMLLNLCACGNRGDSQLKTEAVTLSSIDSNTGTWLGLGGCYQLEPFKAPDNCVFILQHGGEFYFLIEKDTGEIHILHGEKEIYNCRGVADSVFSSEKGIWLQFNEWDGESWDAVISLLSYEGEELKTMRIETPPDCYIRQFVAAEGFLFLNSSSALLVYNEDGTPISSIPHEEWMGGILLGGDGKVYYTDQEENGGGNLYAVDTEAWTFQEIFSYEKGYIFGGTDESPFLLMLPDGIYHLYRDGSSDPLVIWDECGISVNGVSGIEPIEDGSFLLAGMLMEPQRLYPADPATIKPRTEITICMIPSQSVLGSGKDPLLFYSNLSRNVAAFNAQSSDCFVSILDLTENENLTAEQALTKLNTQIMSGYRPDMLLLDGAISPFPFIRQGLLRDCSQDIEHDEQMRMEDILIADAVVNDCGGLYLMTSSFRFETRIGLSSRFGNVWGWSFDQYLDIARKTPEGHMVMYNLTRDYFLENSVSRYCRQAIDWPHGTCDFNNPDFASLLEACSNVIETPEDPNNMVFGPNLMSDGYLVTDLVMVARVTDLASESRHTGQGISVIGWPTPDGSCGTDFYINEPVGVVNGSAHPDLCWEFLKYCLLTPQYGLPVYRPLMEQQIEKARNIEPASNQETNYDELSSPMTEEEIAFFRELLSHVKHTSLCDERVLDVIHQEADRFLAGQCTAEEAAAKIQSRLSIYISEQS